MSLPQPGIGQRIAYYRKLNGWSAERLAQEAGEGVTRAILAQLEAGRRESLSLTQYTAISLALGLPPAALLADVFHPDVDAELPSVFGEGSTTSGRLQMWAAGRGNSGTELPSARKWERVMALLRELYDAPPARAVSRTMPQDEQEQVFQQLARVKRVLREQLVQEGVELAEVDED